MKYLITGHRLFKLKDYDISGIMVGIASVIGDLVESGELSYGYSGMASGVDLWFCRELLKHKIPYAACVPFEEQCEKMEEFEREERNSLLNKAAVIMNVRNSYMVEHADAGIVIWDGNKGGTHNVLQQLVEKKKPFYWINPVSLKIWNCL